MASTTSLTYLLFANLATFSDLSTIFPFFTWKFLEWFSIRSSGLGLILLVNSTLGGVANNVIVSSSISITVVIIVVAATGSIVNVVVAVDTVVIAIAIAIAIANIDLVVACVIFKVVFDADADADDAAISACVFC